MFTIFHTKLKKGGRPMTLKKCNLRINLLVPINTYKDGPRECDWAESILKNNVQFCPDIRARQNPETMTTAC